MTSQMLRPSGVRTYTKLLESGSEERTAFEVSIMQLLDEEETEETALL